MVRPATCHHSIEVLTRRTRRVHSLAKGVVPQGTALFHAFAALVALLVVTSLGSGDGAAQMRRDKLVLKTAGGDKTIEIEVAETSEQKSLGLMYRTALADTAGMLFPYTPPTDITMWMRNTYIPLDMVFIKADGTVHRIEARTEPLSEKVIPAGAECAGVLELAGGAAERLGLKAGDRVLHAHFAPKK
jgi:uncharacterized protein